MKKIISFLLVFSVLGAICLSASAQSAPYAAKLEINNLCSDGEFEALPVGMLPAYDETSAPGADMTATDGWFMNHFDAGGEIVEGLGADGSKCLRLAGDASHPFGAVYWKIPLEKIADRTVINISLKYKVSDALKNGTTQLHIKFISGDSVYGPSFNEDVFVYKQLGSTGTGFTDFFGNDLGNGWYEAKASIACETFAPRTFLRLFAGFDNPAGTLGADAYILIDDIQIGTSVLKENAEAPENLSDINLFPDGNFEGHNVGENLSTEYDYSGWGSTVWDYQPTMIKNDETGNKYLSIAGTGANWYGLANCRIPSLQPGKTYRISFDYKFIGDTADRALQAHASLCSNGSMQIGNPGGWYNVNLLENPGTVLENGFSRVTFDITPDEFETAAFTDLRFFIYLGNENENTGVCIDNVSLYDISNSVSGDYTGDGKLDIKDLVRAKKQGYNAVALASLNKLLLMKEAVKTA